MDRFNVKMLNNIFYKYTDIKILSFFIRENNVVMQDLSKED